MTRESGLSSDYFETESAIIGASFWTAMISYTSLSTLKLYAIAWPMAYRRQVTTRRCLIWIGITWAIILSVSATQMLFIYLFNQGYIAPEKHWYMCQTKGVVFFGLYVITLLAFGATAVYIWRRSRGSGLSASVVRRNRRFGRCLTWVGR